jgi:hypothetical protein
MGPTILQYLLFFIIFILILIWKWLDPTITNNSYTYQTSLILYPLTIFLHP